MSGAPNSAVVNPASKLLPGIRTMALSNKEGLPFPAWFLTFTTRTAKRHLFGNSIAAGDWRGRGQPHAFLLLTFGRWLGGEPLGLPRWISHQRTEPGFAEDESLPLIKQILSPTVVAAAEHAHDLAAGMQRKGPRIAHQHHVIQLVEHAVALAPVTAVAAGHQVFPRRVASARARNHVVQRQFARRQHHAAILARVAVAQQDVFARQSASLMGDAPVLQQAND